MRPPQDIVHQIDVASGTTWLKVTLAALAAALLAFTWNLRCYRNLSDAEAMDAAQLGRQLAEGRGYTTSFIRPFSLFLLARRAQEKAGPPKTGEPATGSRLPEAHPDISNAPGYPVALAGLMKVLPFHYAIPTERGQQHAFWSSDGRFRRHEPDFLIAVFNQVLFLAVTVLAFLWARRLFDSTVAWVAAAVLLGMDLLWRFSTSGLPTMLLLFLFMGVVWGLTLLEGESEKPGRRARALALALATGVLVGLGGLTRYAFGWLILPVLIFLALSTDSRRPVLCLLAVTGFAAVMTPWILRNYELSGAPFGTASYSLMEATGDFPGDRLQRSLHPNVEFLLEPLRAKLFANLRHILQNDLFSLGGGWITAFFLVGLMVGFRSRGVRRMRHFLLWSFGVLAVVQALGRTQRSADSPEINAENLLVLLAPLVVIYGVSLFLLLLDQVKLQTPQLRYAAIALFGALACLPLIFTLLGPRINPIAYPPYHPLVIQEIAGLVNENELMMSDVPWAVAWYGRRPCVWLTLNAGPDADDPRPLENVAAFNDSFRPIHALYLTPKSLDAVRASPGDAGRSSWEKFIAQTVSSRTTPPDFPLHFLADRYLPEQLFLADRKRW